jgi:hypothetical protein
MACLDDPMWQITALDGTLFVLLPNTPKPKRSWGVGQRIRSFIEARKAHNLDKAAAKAAAEAASQAHAAAIHKWFGEAFEDLTAVKAAAYELRDTDAQIRERTAEFDEWRQNMAAAKAAAEAAQMALRVASEREAAEEYHRQKRNAYQRRCIATERILSLTHERRSRKMCRESAARLPTIREPRHRPVAG